MSRAAGTGVLAKSLAFCLGLTLLFTLVTHLLPQVEGEVPEEERPTAGGLTPEAFIAWGEALYNGKGNCALCHNSLGRAPDLLAMDVVAAAETRLADERYRGGAKSAEQYLRESMTLPGAYVVAGFGRKGSRDTESPMPAVDKPPIELSVPEIDAIIAFLQAKDGNGVTVALPAVRSGAGGG